MAIRREHTLILCTSLRCHKVCAALVWEDDVLWLEIQHRHNGVPHVSRLRVDELPAMLPREQPGAPDRP